MAYHQPFQVIGFHSCDKTVGLDVINGRTQLRVSRNIWDWLGDGVYFWEQNPYRALEYALESSSRKQFNKIRIQTPFVVGAIIELGNCLNLIEPESLATLKEAFISLEGIMKEAGKPIPENNRDNRKLDSSVFKHLHASRKTDGKIPFDTIRCAFNEGDPIYPGANFTARLHLQLCVLNHNVIQGYFLPYPLEKYNPFLYKNSLN